MDEKIKRVILEPGDWPPEEQDFRRQLFHYLHDSPDDPRELHFADDLVITLQADGTEDDWWLYCYVRHGMAQINGYPAYRSFRIHMHNVVDSMYEWAQPFAVNPITGEHMLSVYEGWMAYLFMELHSGGVFDEGGKEYLES